MGWDYIETDTVSCVLPYDTSVSTRMRCKKPGMKFYFQDKLK